MAGQEPFDAQIEIVLLRLERLGDLLADAETAFVRAQIGTRAFGRSRRMRKGATAFNIELEPMPWATEARTRGGAAVTGWVQVLADQGDSPPVLLWEIPLAVTSSQRNEITFGDGPMLVARVRPRFSPLSPRVAFVPRVADGSTQTTHAKLVSRPTIAVTITAIRGLYRPLPGDALGGQAVYEPGYTSDDQRGRIFLNRALDGTWKKGHQAIELEATVDVLSGRLPAGAKLVWRLHAEDDPLNDALETHQQWGPILDPADYDTDGVPTGASGSDIRGVPSQMPRWQEVEPHALAAATDTEATTAIVDDKSSVRFLCPDEGGDVFSISAALTPSPGLEVFAHRTGLLTMWHRFDVEAVRMDGACSLTKCFRRVALAFEPANIQLRFADERDVPAKHTYDFWRNGPKPAILTEIKTRFTRHEQPGWLFVMALENERSSDKTTADSARQPPAPPPAPIVFTGKLSEPKEKADRGRGPNLDLVVERGLQLGEVAHIVIVYGALRLFYLVGEPLDDNDDNETRRVVPSFNLLRNWSADSRGYLWSFEPVPLRPDVYGVPLDQPLRIEAFPRVEAAAHTAYWDETRQIARMTGYSPTIDDHWWGVALLHGSESHEQHDHFIDSKARDIVHELVHGLGLHHGCGFYDWRTPRSTMCACNYDAHGLWPGVEATGTPVIGPPDQLSVSGVRRLERLCGLHIRELRRSKFHLHPGFRWKQ